MTVIRKPIEIPGVLNTILGVGRRADGMYYVEDLCTSPNINRWARNKPVRLNTPTDIIDQQRASVNFGFGIPYYLYNSFFDNSKKWEYLTPRGIDHSPAEWNRVDDFDGYNTDAEEAFIRLYMEQYVYRNRATGMYFQFYDGEEISLSELKAPDTLSSSSPKSPLSEFNFCFLMKLGGDYYIWNTGKTPATTTGIESASVPISLAAMYAEHTAAKVAVVLCKDNTIVAGQWKSVQSGQQLTSFSIIPLGFTVSTISDYTGEVRTYASFTDPGSIVMVTHTPTTGQVYYGFRIVFSCTEINVGLPTAPYSFVASMRIVRNGATVQSRAITTESIVATYSETTHRYLFSFNNDQEIRTTPLASQTGDELWVDISYIGGGTSELQTSTKVATL